MCIMEKKNKKPRCEECDSGFVYVTKTKIICRRCGHEELKEK